MNYFLLINGQNEGPYTLDQIGDILSTEQQPAETPCWKEGDPGWKTLGEHCQLNFEASPSGPPPLPAAPIGESRAVSALLDPRFSHPHYTVRRKVFKLFGGAFHIYAPDDSVAFFSEMKAFKLKEDIRVYSGENKAEEVLVIKARKILDFSSTYDVWDPKTNEKLGALARKGLKSMFRDEWVFLDNNDQQTGKILEDSLVLALVRRLLDIPFIPQHYTGDINSAPVCDFKQNFNPFVMKVKLDFSKDQSGLLDRRLGIAAAVLLCAIEGKQG